MYWKNRGAIPRSARAWIVRVEPYVQELATEMTEIVMTALKTDGRPLTPASLMASTNGEALVLAPLDPKRPGLSDGRIRPSKKRETM